MGEKEKAKEVTETAAIERIAGKGCPAGDSRKGRANCAPYRPLKPNAYESQ